MGYWWAPKSRLPRGIVLTVLDLEDGRIFVKVPVEGPRTYACYLNGISTGILYTREEVILTKQALPS